MAYTIEEQVTKYRTILERNLGIAKKTDETLCNLIKNTGNGRYAHDANQARNFLINAIGKFEKYYSDLTDEVIIKRFAKHNKDKELIIYVRWERSKTFNKMIERQEKAKQQIANIAFDLWG